MIAESVVRWSDEHALPPIHVDCVTAIMLKIIDGKCKMASNEKRVMADLYDLVKTQPGITLGKEIHQLIATARDNADESLKTLIYEKRVLAETVISRPVMKAFKAMIRQTGLLTPAENEDETA